MSDPAEAPSKKRRVIDRDVESTTAADSSHQQERPSASLDPSAKEFILNTLGHISSQTPWNPQNWGNLGQHWKSDADIALAAIKCHLSPDLQALPESLQNREFLLEAVKANPDLWKSLPHKYENDFEFVRVIPTFKNYDLACAVLERFPDQRNNRDLWLKLIDTAADLDDASQIFNEYASGSIRGDQEIVTRAYERFMGLLQHADPSLFENQKFMEHLLVGDKKWQGFNSPFRYIPHSAQLRWSNLMMQSFQKRIAEAKEEWCPWTTAEWAGALAPELRNDRKVMVSWFKGGGTYCDFFPSAWKEDEEIFLLIAEHSENSEAALRAFREASPKLLQSKAFVLQAIEHKAILYRSIPELLQRDFTVAVTALASSSSFREEDSWANGFFIHYWNGNEFLDSLRDWVEKKLHSHAIFMDVILPGIRFGTESTALSLLNQGSETAKCYTSRIAEFMGVPRGKELRLLRRAEKNFASQDEPRKLLWDTKLDHFIFESESEESTSEYESEPTPQSNTQDIRKFFKPIPKER